MQRVMSTGGLTRRRGFWIAYVALACVALFAAWRLFPQAIPIVNLDVKLSRQEAVNAAKRIAAERDLAPVNARTAVRFAHDDATQNYIELEGGGKQAFAALLEANTYSPY